MTFTIQPLPDPCRVEAEAASTGSGAAAPVADNSQSNDGPVRSCGGASGPLKSIGLDELDAQAALQIRVDTKYVLPQSLFTRFVASSLDRLRILQIDGSRSFEYRSVYFDTPDLASFRAHVQRRRRRFKIRTRTYGQSGECVLEVKTKGGRAETVKDRLVYVAGQAEFLDVDAKMFIADLVPDADVTGLVPTMETRYVRTTMLDEPTQSRITADTSLTFHRGLVSAALDDAYVLVETKSLDGAGHADRWLWQHQVRPVSVSKYCVGVAMLHPGVTANPWHRIMQRHFVWG